MTIPREHSDRLTKLYNMLVDFLRLNNINRREGITIAIQMIVDAAEMDNIPPSALKETFDLLLSEYEKRTID